MSVLQFRSRKSTEGDVNSILESVVEGVRLLAAVALVFWLPLLLLSIVSSQTFHLRLMLWSEAAGGLLGIWRYRYQEVSPLSCVPTSSIPDVPSTPRVREMKRAA